MEEHVKSSEKEEKILIEITDEEIEKIKSELSEHISTIKKGISVFFMKVDITKIDEEHDKTETQSVIFGELNVIAKGLLNVSNQHENLRNSIIKEIMKEMMLDRLKAVENMLKSELEKRKPTTE